MKDLRTVDAIGTKGAGKTYDVIVVGAGIAGLTSAAYVAKAGYTTLLCEKSEKPGGLVGSFTRKGFTFDAGIRAFENSGIVFPMIRQLGIAMDFVKNPVAIGLEDELMILAGVESLNEYATMLTLKFPDNRVTAQEKKIQENRGGDSIFSIYLAVDLVPLYFSNHCGPHCFYTPSKAGLSSIHSENWQAVLADETRSESDQRTALQTWLIEYLTLTTYEISCPALRDSALAPTGKTGVIVSTLMDYRLVKAIDEAGWYQVFKELCEEKIISVLNETIFPGLINQVEDRFSSTPLTIERLTGNSGGAITGWAFPADHGTARLPAVSVFRKIAKTIVTPIPHIHQAGQWTFSPSGLPVSILTGKLVADRVIKILKKQGRKDQIKENPGVSQ